MSNNLDEMRRVALDSVDSAARNLRYVIAVAALLEAACLTAFIYLMDFESRLHWLILIAACLVYMTIGIGLVALGSYVKLNTLRLLRAMEAHHSSRDSR